MATTYGERLLAEAEERVRAGRRRRRVLLLFVPALAIVLLATWQTLTHRQANLEDAGLIRMALDHGMTVGYAGLLVGFPLYAALGPALNVTAAGIALVAGPVAMPLWFGPGWSLWQRLAIAAVCLLVIAARRSQPDRAIADRPPGRRR